MLLGAHAGVALRGVMITGAHTLVFYVIDSIQSMHPESNRLVNLCPSQTTSHNSQTILMASNIWQQNECFDILDYISRLVS